MAADTSTGREANERSREDDDDLVVGEGLRVGAGAYKEGTAVSPNPYYQSGTVETSGYGGPPNIGAVTPVFAKARHNALLFAGEIVSDTTGNAAGIGKGVGEGLAPELVTLTPLTGQAARDAEVDRVEAAAAYQTSNPVMLHHLDDGVLAAGQPADDYGNPVEDASGLPDVEGRDGERSTGPVSGGGSQQSGSQQSGSTVSDTDEDYDDKSSRDESQSVKTAKASGGQQGGASGQPSAARPKVDPTRQQGSSS